MASSSDTVPVRHFRLCCCACGTDVLIFRQQLTFKDFLIFQRAIGSHFHGYGMAKLRVISSGVDLSGFLLVISKSDLSSLVLRCDTCVRDVFVGGFADPSFVNVLITHTTSECDYCVFAPLCEIVDDLAEESSRPARWTADDKDLMDWLSCQVDLSDMEFDPDCAVDVEDLIGVSDAEVVTFDPSSDGPIGLLCPSCTVYRAPTAARLSRHFNLCDSQFPRFSCPLCRDVFCDSRYASRHINNNACKESVALWNK